MGFLAARNRGVGLVCRRRPRPVFPHGRGAWVAAAALGGAAQLEPLAGGGVGRPAALVEADGARQVRDSVAISRDSARAPHSSDHHAPRFKITTGTVRAMMRRSSMTDWRARYSKS